MDIKDFKYAWRYTDSKYALFSSSELSEMSVLSEEGSSELWNKICDSEIFQTSSYIKGIINKTNSIYINNCGWGDTTEESTKNKLMKFFKSQGTEKVYVLYDCISALSISTELFCNKWSDFCYPSDSILIMGNSKLLIYYEDVLYGPVDIKNQFNLF